MPTNRDVLTAAARDALRAPSPMNTQPWTWQVTDPALELYADRERRIAVIDPLGKLVQLACGIAFHHARVSLAVTGVTPVVERLAISFDANPLARLSIGPTRGITSTDRALRDAIHLRRTDRRPFADRPVPTEIIEALAAAAAAEGAALHVVNEGQMPMLAVAVAKAGEVEMSDPDYRNELLRWTNRPVWSGDGIAAATTVQRVPRRVAMRQLATAPNEGMPVDPGGDRGAAYLIVYRPGDGPADWFAAGEATSAVLLTATSLGLSSAPITDVIEVAHPRTLLTGLLPTGGHPFVVIRCGWAASSAPLADAPRREPADVITVKLNA